MYVYVHVYVYVYVYVHVYMSDVGCFCGYVDLQQGGNVCMCISAHVFCHVSRRLSGIYATLTHIYTHIYGVCTCTLKTDQHMCSVRCLRHLGSLCRDSVLLLMLFCQTSNRNCLSRYVVYMCMQMYVCMYVCSLCRASVLLLMHFCQTSNRNCSSRYAMYVCM
jgi:hypothetical protein